MWSIDRLRPVLSILLPAGLRAVMDVQWQPGVPDTLAVVYAPATVVLWNTKTATKIRGKRTVSELEGRMRPDVHAFCAVWGPCRLHLWSKEFQHDLLQLAFDPFQPSSAVVLAVSGFLYSVTGA